MLKQIIVMRRDLKMRRGKEIAQGSHASMGAYLKATKMAVSLPKVKQELEDWLANSFTKVCLQIDNEEELLAIYQKAEDAGVPAALIVDSGKTEFHGIPTTTCLGLGPCNAEQLNALTGHLKLY